MAAKRKYDAVATVGTYRTAGGEEKKRYANVGVVFEDDQGRLSLKLDTIPCGPGWSGFISFYEPKDQGQQRQSPQQPQSPRANTESKAQWEDDGDSIPF